MNLSYVTSQYTSQIRHSRTHLGSTFNIGEVAYLVFET